MAKVIWHITMSLDGFIAGPGDAMDWVFEHAGPNAVAAEVVETTGALVVGRRTYEVEDRIRGGFYGGAWRGPYFVVTHDAPATVPDWMTGTFVSDGVPEAVARAKTAAGERNVVVLGASIAHQCIAGGLLDEIVAHVAPVLLGGGVRLFGGPGSPRVDLEPISVGQSGQVTDLRYRVVGERREATARAIVEGNAYMTLATADANGAPWASPVWFASDDCRELFWISDPNARHSRNIAERPEVSIVVFDSRVAPGTGRGVYMAAVAEQVTGPDLDRGVEVFSRVSRAQGAGALTRDRVQEPARLRLYRARASEHWLLDNRDRRVPVQL
jgi:dihydrofolate reductase